MIEVLTISLEDVYKRQGYANETLKDSNGNNYNFYFEEGTHTITIKQENEPIMEAYRYALLLQEHITNFQLEITKITGSDVDTERNWKMTKYIPEIPKMCIRDSIMNPSEE